MDFAYAGENSWIDHIEPNNPDAFIAHINPADGEGAGVAHLSPTTNTIGNSFEFGGLIDDEGDRSTKTELLESYLDFLFMDYTDLWPPVIDDVTEFDFTLDETGPYVIEAVITDNVGVTSASMWYNTNGGAFTEVAMTTTLGDGVYSADIPGQVVGTTVGYYITAEDAEANVATEPTEGAFVFDVVSHLPPTNPEAVSGLDGRVELEWRAAGNRTRSA